MTTMASVKNFLTQKSWAFVGVSANKKKFGCFAFQELKKKGIRIFAVNPRLTTLGDETVYPSISKLPQPVSAVLIAVPPSKTIEIVKEAADQGIQHIWMQQGAESKEAIAFCREKGINCISGECILMFADPTGFPHSIHRLIWKLIGRLPK